MLKRLAAGLVAAAIAGSGVVAVTAVTAAPASAAASVQAATSGCRYKVRNVRTRLNVRKGPGTRYRVVDKLYPRQVTRGKCRKVGKWRAVRGDHGRKGYSHGRYLKKIQRGWW